MFAYLILTLHTLAGHFLPLLLDIPSPYGGGGRRPGPPGPPPAPGTPPVPQADVQLDGPEEMILWGLIVGVLIGLVLLSLWLLGRLARKARLERAGRKCGPC